MLPMSEQMLYCLKRIGEPCKEHVDNNFNPLTPERKTELQGVRQELCKLMERTQSAIENNTYDDADDILKKGDELKNTISLKKGDELKNTISALRKQQMNRMQESDSNRLKVSMVYLNILQETQELVSIWRHLLRASRFFQGDYVPQEGHPEMLTEHTI